jgi:alkanesulfonate monooxygenase
MSTNPATAFDAASTSRIQVFATCPSSSATPDNYLERVSRVARWSERAGCTGILVYTDNSLVDPWLVSQLILQNSKKLCPLVAVQPAYMHPYSAAKMVASLAFLQGRRVFLNMVAGGFKNDLTALNDTTPHDLRYQRLIEYTTIIRQLLEGHAVNFEGQFYRVNALSLQPRMPRELMPGILVSGSSDAGMAAARAMGAIAVKYPEPPEQSRIAPDQDTPCGIRIGIVARRRDDQAWEIAEARFPEDRGGQLTRQLANKVSDSAWHKQLAEIGKHAGADRGTYWLHPFENYQTNCPYLVGRYEKVAAELARYMSAGYRTFILDIPAAEEEFEHISTVFQLALREAGA